MHELLAKLLKVGYRGKFFPIWDICAPSARTLGVICDRISIGEVFKASSRAIAEETQNPCINSQKNSWKKSCSPNAFSKILLILPSWRVQHFFFQISEKTLPVIRELYWTNQRILLNFSNSVYLGCAAIPRTTFRRTSAETSEETYRAISVETSEWFVKEF